MCLAIPGKLIEIYKDGGLMMGRLDYAGTIGVACLECVPEAQLGQYVIVHAGFGINVLDEEEAQKVYEVWQGMADAASGEENGRT